MTKTARTTQRTEPSAAQLHSEMQAYAAKMRNNKEESFKLLKRIGVMTNTGKLSKSYGG